MSILDNYKLCGACQIWGATPRMAGGKCCDCDRTKDEILAEFGVFEITPAMIQELRELQVFERHIDQLLS